MSTEANIHQLARRLLLQVEQAVRSFPRCHKYQTGGRLREQAHAIAVLANRAWRDRAQQLQWTEELVWALDEFKLTLQLGDDLQAFNSTGQFAELALTVRELGKQVGGWFKEQKRVKGQNAAAPVAPSPRSPILSAQATSAVEVQG